MSKFLAWLDHKKQNKIRKDFIRFQYGTAKLQDGYQQFVFTVSKRSQSQDKTILRPSYLHNGISCIGKMTSLYWIRAQVSNISTLWRALIYQCEQDTATRLLASYHENLEAGAEIIAQYWHITAMKKTRQHNTKTPSTKIMNCSTLSVVVVMAVVIIQLHNLYLQLPMIRQPLAVARHLLMNCDRC